MSRYGLTDFEWREIEQLLPNKPRGMPCEFLWLKGALSSGRGLGLLKTSERSRTWRPSRVAGSCMMHQAVTRCPKNKHRYGPTFPFDRRIISFPKDAPNARRGRRHFAG